MHRLRRTLCKLSRPAPRNRRSRKRTRAVGRRGHAGNGIIGSVHHGTEQKDVLVAACGVIGVTAQIGGREARDGRYDTHALVHHAFH